MKQLLRKHARNHLPGGADPLLNGDIGFYELEPNGGNPATAGTTTVVLSASFAGTGAGVDLLDLAIVGAPTGPAVKRIGMYVFKARVGFTVPAGGDFPSWKFAQLDMFTNNESSPQASWAQQATQIFPLDTSLVPCFCTVQIVRYMDSANYFQMVVRREATQDLHIEGELSAQRIY